MMLFDRYQRYETINRIIKIIKKQNVLSNLKILEVGANAQKILKEFIDDEVYFTDIQMIEGLENDPMFFVADATNLTGIADETYDIVVASDVFEHIPVKSRNAFISEIYRVSNIGAILCFPIGNEYVSKAENDVNETFKRLFGKDYIWLLEHIQNGLPNINEFEKVLHSMKIDFIKFEHGEIGNWARLQKAYFCLSVAYQTSSGEALNNLYNNHFYEHDIGKNNYRIFYFLNKKIENTSLYKKCFQEIFKKNIEFQKIDSQIYDLALEGCTTRIMQTNILINQLIDIMSKQNSYILEMNNKLQELEKCINVN